MVIMKCIDFLKENGITPTKQRVELADLIFRENQHFTASDLIDIASKSGLEISQATIYNTLCLFEKKNILKTIDLQNDCKFYDTNLSPHHHVYNTSTNLLTDIKEEEINFSKLPSIPKSLVIEKTEVLIKVKNKN
tara:strand:+ start:445 stop:849 length:405 start_codon:yes stop_codon:yes gene_type:complete